MSLTVLQHLRIRTENHSQRRQVRSLISITPRPRLPMPNSSRTCRSDRMAPREHRTIRYTDIAASNRDEFRRIHHCECSIVKPVEPGVQKRMHRHRHYSIGQGRRKRAPQFRRSNVANFVAIRVISGMTTGANAQL